MTSKILLNRYFGSYIRPIVKWFDVGVGDIDAAMAHRVAEIVVPVGTVDIVIERHTSFEHQVPFGVRKIVVCTPVIHNGFFGEDGVLSRWSGCASQSA